MEVVISDAIATRCEEKTFHKRGFLLELLVVSYTERKDKIRIISARRATRAERKNYEETN